MKKILSIIVGLAIASCSLAVSLFFAELIYNKLVPEVDGGVGTVDCGNRSKSLLVGLQRNCTGRWTENLGNKTSSVKFSTDEFGRRKVFSKKNKSKIDKGLAVFFGGSDVLGQGIDDEDTLANQFSQISDFSRVKNYGGQGFGPQHPLELLQFSDLRKEVPPDPVRNVFIFTYGDSHVSRASGVWAEDTWKRKFPYYELDSDNNLIYKGTFISGNRFSKLEKLLKKSRMLNDLSTTILSWIGIRDWEIILTARIFQATKKELEKKYNNSRFIVVIYPTAYHTSQKMKNYLTEFEVEFFDYTNVWDVNDPENSVPDGHYSPKVYRTLAEKLAADLKLN